MHLRLSVWQIESWNENRFLWCPWFFSVLLYVWEFIIQKNKCQRGRSSDEHEQLSFHPLLQKSLSFLLWTFQWIWYFYISQNTSQQTKLILKTVWLIKKQLLKILWKNNNVYLNSYHLIIGCRVMGVYVSSLLSKS